MKTWKYMEKKSIYILKTKNKEFLNKYLNNFKLNI